MKMMILTRKQYVKEGLKSSDEYVWVGDEKLTPLKLINYERFLKYITSIYDDYRDSIKCAYDVLKLMPSDGFLYSLIDRDLMLRDIYCEEVTDDIIALYRETIQLTLLLLYKFDKMWLTIYVKYDIIYV